MKRALLAVAVGLVLCAGSAAAAWGPSESFFVAQGQKGRPGPGPGAGGERGAPPRDMRQDRQQEQRRERMTEDERQSLHRDLDKANREIYGRRPQK